MAPDRGRPGLAACGARSWRQPERRVPVRDQGERVADDAVVPAENAFDEAEHAARIAASEHYGEPGRDHDEERRDVQEEKHLRSLSAVAQKSGSGSGASDESVLVWRRTSWPPTRA